MLACTGALSVFECFIVYEGGNALPGAMQPETIRGYCPSF